MSDDGDLNCGSGGGDDRFFGIRIGSIFIIWALSTAGALFPVLAARTTWLRVPQPVFDFAKFFGSGVIIATAFIHLLGPGLEELGSPCLNPAWGEYPYALALALLSIFAIFIVELIAFRWGSSRLAQLGVHHDPHGHQVGSHAAHGPETDDPKSPSDRVLPRGSADIESQHLPALAPEEKRDTDVAQQVTHIPGHAHNPNTPHTHMHNSYEGLHSPAAAQILGVAILEFGVVLHSVLIGLTLAVSDQFPVLFPVLIFHQTFEGLGLGARLSQLKMGHAARNIGALGAVLYGLTTPVGIAAGLGVRDAYNPDGTTPNIVSGILDSLSAGVLIYTGLVELLAHEFLFNQDMINASNGRLAYALGCMLAGTALMALLGKWA